MVVRLCDAGGEVVIRVFAQRVVLIRSPIANDRRGGPGAVHVGMSALIRCQIESAAPAIPYNPIVKCVEIVFSPLCHESERQPIANPAHAERIGEHRRNHQYGPAVTVHARAETIILLIVPRHARCEALGKFIRAAIPCTREILHAIHIALPRNGHGIGKAQKIAMEYVGLPVPEIALAGPCERDLPRLFRDIDKRGGLRFPIGDLFQCLGGLGNGGADIKGTEAVPGDTHVKGMPVYCHTIGRRGNDIHAVCGSLQKTCHSFTSFSLTKERFNGERMERDLYGVIRRHGQLLDLLL